MTVGRSHLGDSLIQEAINGAEDSGTFIDVALNRSRRLGGLNKRAIGFNQNAATTHKGIVLKAHGFQTGSSLLNHGIEEASIHLIRTRIVPNGGDRFTMFPQLREGQAATLNLIG
jgi:hypothetical protein